MNRLSRRGLLLAVSAGTGLALAGCSADLPGIPGVGENPDDEARRSTAESERALIAAYEVVIAALPNLAGEIGFIAEQHAQHLAALEVDEVPPSSASPAVGTGDRRSAVADLRKLENAAAGARLAACDSAGDAALIQILARVGASEASHAAYLAGVR